MPTARLTLSCSLPSPRCQVSPDYHEEDLGIEHEWCGNFTRAVPAPHAPLDPLDDYSTVRWAGHVDGRLHRHLARIARPSCWACCARLSPHQMHAHTCATHTQCSLPPTHTHTTHTPGAGA